MAEDSEIPRKKSGPLGTLVQAESMIQLALAVPAGCFAGMLLGAAGGFIRIFTYLGGSSKRGGQ
jgi:hypothetical protein